MLAAEVGNLQVVNQLLSINFPINLKINGKTAADFAYENKHQNVLFALLKVDSLYPKNFNSETSAGDLKKFIESVQNFFNDIDGENFNKIEGFLKKNSNMSFVFNDKNESAVGRAIKIKKFDVLEKLLEFNLSLAPHERLNHYTENFTEEDFIEIATFGVKDGEGELLEDDLSAEVKTFLII